MDSSKQQSIGIIWALLGIAYFVVMYLTDFNTTVIVIGAMVFAVIAVTTPWWSRIISSRGL